MRSTSSIAWPDEMPGAAAPKSFTAGRLLKRASESGPEAYLTFASERNGIISPFSERT